MNRRYWLTSVVAASAAMYAGIANAQQRLWNRGRLRKYPNAFFYDRDGGFNPKQAKLAFADLFRYHNYSLTEKILASSDFWQMDFQTGDFSNVGMGGIFFINDKENGYFGHEIYLLPGQMIPEHYHVAAEDKPAKHEMWQVRHGSVYTMSQGGALADLPAGVKLPESQLQNSGITCFLGKKLNVGDQDVLAKLEQPHFMIAGAEGAIVTEYANYHSMEGLKFTNPKVSL